MTDEKEKYSIIKKMKKTCLILFGFVLATCQINQKSETVDFGDFLQEHFIERLELNPISATSLGISGYNHQLPNSLTQEHKDRSRKFYQKYNDGLANYDREKLSEEEKISYDLLKWNCDIELEKLNFPLELMPLDLFFSIPVIVGRIATGKGIQPFNTVRDYDDWLVRLNKYMEWCDTAIANMDKGIEMDFVIPKAITKKIIPQFKALNHGLVEDHLFYMPIKSFPEDFPESERHRLANEYKQMINENIIPKYKQITDYLEQVYLPACRTTSGFSDLPNGSEMYKWHIKYFTTNDLSAEEIYELGLQQVALVRTEMESVKDELGFDGNLREFLEHVRTIKELMPFKDPEEVIQNFYNIYERMKPNLKRLFDNVPKTPFEVRRVDALLEKTSSAHYSRGSMDGSRPGIFYVPIPDVAKYNVFNAENLFLHEAIPGHHYQISLQLENDELPEFRRSTSFAVYNEGWALYCESLGKELGLYRDPYQYLGMLSMKMNRAVRLVVDVGLHAKGWTREKAIQYALSNIPLSEDFHTAAIERYMASPGQALAYTIGQLKILDLRKRAEEQLGNDFDIREFHNAMLESGSMPLSVLEQKMDRWIASKINMKS
jgi:uncharacterized protein (DUF885 family)